MTWTQYLLAVLPHLAAQCYRVFNALVSAALAQPISAEDRELIAPRIGGRSLPTVRVSEFVPILGRSTAKTQTAGALVIYLALFCTWTVSAGQIPVALLLCATVDQSAIAFRFVLGLLQSNESLWQEVADVTKQTIEFKNGVRVEIAASDYRTVRGYSLICVICDELAYWPTSPQSANPDSEVLAAVRPGLARFAASMLIAISSPYARRGELFEYYRKYFGQNDPRVLVAHGATADINPTFDKAVIEDALSRDPAAASAEYLAIFRSDVAAFIDAELVDGCTRSDPRELPRRAATPKGSPIVYVAGIDASGGRGDATAAAVAHDEDGRVVIDAVRRWPAPHDPAVVAGEVAAFLKLYGLAGAGADQYAAGFSRAVYSAAGVGLYDAPGTRSDCYLHLLPMLTQGRIELAPEPILRVELLSLERRTGRSGKDTVDHRPGSHDDVSNCVAIASWLAARRIQAAGPEMVVQTSAINAGLEDFDNRGRLGLEAGIERMFSHWNH